jgi:hypothetical protein
VNFRLVGASVGEKHSHPTDDFIRPFAASFTVPTTTATTMGELFCGMCFLSHFHVHVIRK